MLKVCLQRVPTYKQQFPLRLLLVSGSQCTRSVLLIGEDFLLLVKYFTWPDDLQIIVVQSGPVPHLSCSAKTKSVGGLFRTGSLLPDHTVTILFGGRVNLSGKTNPATGCPSTFCWMQYPPISSSYENEYQICNPHMVLSNKIQLPLDENFHVLFHYRKLI